MGKKRRKVVPKRGYDALADKYEDYYGNNLVQIELVNWLINKLPKNSHVLDVGCGTGIPVAKMLSDNGFKVTGIDNSSEMIKRARNNVPTGEFLEMNVKRLRLNKHFQAITAFFTLLHVQKELFPKILRKLVGLLEDEGYFIISMIDGDFDEENMFLGKKMHYTAYKKDDLKKLLLDAGLKIIFEKTQEFTPKIKGAETEKQLFFVCKKSFKIKS